MKKLLAVVLAVVFVVSSVFIAFAVDKSSLPSAPFPDFLKQFDQGNGNFLFPVSFVPLLGSASTHFSYYEECYNVYNNDIENYYYLFRYNPPVTSSALPYFSVFLIPKTGFRFTTSPAGSYTQYGFRCGSNIKFHQIYFYYDSELGYFVNGKCSKSLDFVYFCSSDSREDFYFLSDDALYSSIPDNYVSNISRFGKSMSGISSVSVIDYSDYPSVSNYKLTVNYLYFEDKPAAESVTRILEAGAEYSIPSPEVPGYTPSIPLVTGTMPDEDLTIDVYYSKTFHSLTVKYQYADGSTVSPDVVFQYPPGFVYDVPSPEVEGYQADKLSVSGTMRNEPLEVVVTYSPIPYTLTVNYQYADGSTAAESHQEQLFIGASYSISSPVIEGFHPNQTAVTGIMPARDVISTVTYREDPGGSGGPGPAGPGEGGGPGEGEGGDPGGEGGSGNDPFIPVLPPYSGNDPFIVPGVPGYSGNDPFVVPHMPGYSGYDPFIVRPPPAFYGYDPFKMPEKLGG